MSPFPDNELLQRFHDVNWRDWNRNVAQKVLAEYGVNQVSELPRFAAEHLLDVVSKRERGIKVTVIPATDEGTSERNKRRLLKKGTRLIGIEGMMLDQFERLTMTDQFLFLKARIPAKTVPSEIKRWVE